MKKILITGCNGQLGRAVNQFYAGRTDLELINTDVEELDIANIDAAVSLVREVNPYAIINCAAYTAVDACETNQDTAFKVNTLGARNLAVAAEQIGAKLLHISTDYVFDGTKKGAYVETDATGPASVYGVTKEAAEKMVTQLCNRFFILRTAWLYGDGKNFAKTMLRIAENNDKVRVVCDQIGTPTSTLELTKGIDSLLFSDNYGLFHATCEGQCSWADFARKVFTLAGKEVRVEDVTTEEYLADYPQQAKRPANSVLENYMFKMTGGYSFAPWEEAIAEYMKTLR
ncbi:MAG: dTDP-4-dehydrorhamnose reductase [Lachnospiraceae bacterium]